MQPIVGSMQRHRQNSYWASSRGAWANLDYNPGLASLFANRLVVSVPTGYTTPIQTTRAKKYKKMDACKML
jgi:hypothetical protein